MKDAKKDKGYLNKGIIVHHKKYIKDQDFINWNKELLLLINNLELLCLHCHNKEGVCEKALNDNAEINLETGKYIINKKLILKLKTKDEKNLIFYGFVSFLDKSKPSATKMI